jgi:exonuclease III
MALEALGPRIIQASFKTSNAKVGLKVIQCYVPTNDKDERTKEEFCYLPQNVLDEGRGRGIIILMGDFNTNI